MSLRLFLWLPLFFSLGLATRAQSQEAPPASLPQYTAYERPIPLTIVDIAVEGVGEGPIQDFVRKASGLRLGQTVEVPGDPALAAAVRALYRVGLFEDVKVEEAGREGRALHLVLRVRSVPRLSGYRLEGVSGGDRRALERDLPLFTGGHIRPADVARAEQIIRGYFVDKGYPLVQVDTRRTDGEDGSVALTFLVEQGPQVTVASVHIEGNEALDDGRLRKVMQTKEGSGWRFWRKNTFSPEVYRQDLERLLTLYREQGFYDARIVRDTTYLRERDGRPEMVVEIDVEEGPRYFLRRIAWEGNRVFTDAELTEALGLAPGDAYNGTRLEENLYFNPEGTDVASKYMNEGYLRFNVVPSVRVVGGDSLDLVLEVFEGDVYTFGQIGITGNFDVREHVIRRELATVPGQPFSRAAIQASLMRLMQAGYFSPEALAAGPDIRVDDEKKTVDLTYRLAEVRRNPLSFGGSYSGGLIFQMGLNLTNFSLRNALKPRTWNPLPRGDGQRLSLGVQTAGTDYQLFSLDFVEPWFRGRPNPLGLSVSYARIADGFQSNTDGTGGLRSWTVRAFHDRRLVPGLTFSAGVRYRYNNNRGWSATLPDGRSHELALAPSLTFSSLDHPVFPRKGVFARFGVEVAPPLRGVQYHTWRLQGKWQLPLTKHLGVSLSADLGYTGSLTGEAVSFRRFSLGGSPFDAQGFDDFFGETVVYLRGYPARALGPRDAAGHPVGGRLLNKFSAELQWHALSGPALTLTPYAFFDAANTWSSFGAYRPDDLFRSAGVGLRMNLPVLGLLEVSYGYNLDRFLPLGSEQGQRGWRLQFSLGRTFEF